ncbi:P-loop containing nucleoside triphosphate hydrolase protein, partial [Massariosphaeria phaeospora]
MRLADASTVYRLTHFGTYAVVTILETALCLQHSWFSIYHDHVQLALHILRVLLLVWLCAITLELAPRISNTDEDSATPLYPGSERTPHGALPKLDLEGDSQTKGDNGRNASNEQLQRVEKLGGWWAYLKEFRIFLPYIIPARNKKFYFYGVIVILLILSDRASNMLGPRLLGDIVQQVYELQGTDQLPWRHILFLVFVIKIPHDLVLTPIQRGVLTRFNYWSYQSLFGFSFETIMGLSLEYHDNKKSGEVQEAINQARSLHKLVDDFIVIWIPFVLDVGLAFGYLTYLFDVYVGLVLITTYVCYGIVSYKLTPWVVKQGPAYKEAGRAAANIMSESIANWPAAFYFNRQDYQKCRFNDVTKRELWLETQVYDRRQILTIAHNLVLILGHCAAMLLAARRAVRRDKSVGDFVTLLMYWAILTKPLFTLQHVYKELIALTIDAEALLQLHQTEPTVVDAEDAKDLVFKGGKVEYRNVSFAYNGQKPVIKELNFTVPPGSTVAFVGQTGGGKTTTCDKLLFRGYDVSSGSILIDGQDIRHVTQHSLRETLGIVRQEQCFYNDTVLEVVRFARLEATNEEVYEACRNAAVHDQILRFPKGYQSMIGERGVKLSGGERQRLAIAQVFLRNPKIIVLDEATSTVDNVTESEIQDAFSRICEGRTTFVIAHRLSTVEHADQIFVLDQGRIAERGNHEQLLEIRGKYYDLWTKK